MDMFPEGAPQESEARLIREAMAEAAEGAPPLPDLVPAALAGGRRRRTRARAAIGGGMVGVVALGVLGAMLPSWGTGEGAARVGAPAAPSMGHGTPSPGPTRPTTDFPTRPPSFPGPSRTPVHIQPTPGESSMADLPATERGRQEEFQQKAAAVLDEMLPAAFGTVRPVDLAVSRYQGGSGGQVFPVVFSVQPTGDVSVSPAQEPCHYGQKKKYRCEEAALPDGIVARTVTAVGSSKGGKDIVGVSVRFRFKDSTVVLSADGDDSAVVSAPVTTDQLLQVARDARFLHLVQYADAFPMEPKRGSVHGG
ncbi:hypothetical protein [Streptomyces atratus]|uniref:Uncharacterized protein n=1 Tax=Streptomyces atratus TaxID=1893 RepID=A0A2Z5JGX3_STRAR|nr:hypothetical protein [Streptomyces atratus]AXE79484.1 hypothetical protein C5746_24105 [Streptomyces atratus]